MIYRYFDNIRIEKENKGLTNKKLSFGPSYLNKCKRQIFYQKTNTPQSNPTETHSYIKFALGDSAHEAIQGIFQKIGIWLEGEDFKYTTWNDIDWCYRIDGKLLINDNEWIGEIKSVYASGYNSIEKEPRIDHELQLLMYMIFEGVNNGFILYVGRDNGLLVDYYYTLDTLYKKHEKYITQRVFELKQVIDNIVNNELPERDHEIVIKNNKGVLSNKFTKDKVNYKSDWQCNYCSWKSMCWKDVNEEIKNHKFYVNGDFID
jgi:hypothetical protein